jgi:hypothetical protein
MEGKAPATTLMQFLQQNMVPSPNSVMFFDDPKTYDPKHGVDKPDKNMTTISWMATITSRKTR